jgi:HAD superfamily hydrolase (TIGR01490 family)
LKGLSVSGSRFAVFDVDGTLIRWQLYHAVADALDRLGYFEPEKFKSVRQARMKWKQRASEESFKAYEITLVKTYEQILKRLTTAQLEEAVDLVFDEYKDQAYTFTRDLLKELKRKGYLLFAISNSQQEIVQKIADHYSFDDCVGAVYGRSGSRFTGHKTVYLANKDEILKHLVDKHGASWQGSVAVGDSASDMPMLKIVDRPIAFNPEKRLLKEAKSKGWEIVLERKNVVYRLKAENGQFILV